MRNPLERLKYLPWLELFQAAALTTLIVTTLDIVLFQIIGALLFSSAPLLIAPLFQVLIFAAAAGIGALAVFILERVFPQVFINAGTLWALAVCLAVLLFVKSNLQIPTFLAGISYLQFIGIILGISLKGRRYWR